MNLPYRPFFLLILMLLKFQFLLTSCGYIPTPPSAYTYKKSKLADGLDVYHMNDEDSTEKNLNLLFIAADAIIQNNFISPLTQAYGKNPPLLEDLAWWHYFPLLRKTYNTVMRIPPEYLTHENLFIFLEYLEALGRPYDVILLTHGFHNHLSDGDTGYFLSYRELDKWRGRLKKLNMVFMQACFSCTLGKDWMNAGAKYVICYNGLNRNFFYLKPFLSWYHKKTHSIAEIVEKKTDPRRTGNLHRTRPTLSAGHPGIKL